MKEIRPDAVEWEIIQSNTCTYFDLGWTQWLKSLFVSKTSIVAPPKKEVWECKFIQGRAMNLTYMGYRIIESDEEYRELFKGSS